MKISKNTICIDSLESQLFQDNYLKVEQPVQVKNFVTKQNFYRRWTPEFLSENYGEKLVGVFDDTVSRQGRSYKKPDKHISFKQFLEGITNGEKKYRLFLFNIFRIAPELREDLEFPKLRTIFLTKLPYTFFGHKGIVTRIHQDMYFSNVFLLQIHGRKKVILISPEQSELLYRLPLNVHTEANITKPDYQKYPALRYVEGTEYILEPGDLLFIPSGWWHHIEYMDGGYSLSLRSLSKRPLNLLRGILNVTILTHLDELLVKIAGNSWFKLKCRIAERRANNRIKLIDPLFLNSENADFKRNKIAR